MAKKTNSVLTEAYLMELYRTALTNDDVCGLLCQHMKSEYLPGRDFQVLLDCIKRFHKEHHCAPGMNLAQQMASDSRSVRGLVSDIQDLTGKVDADAVVEQFETYIRQVRFQLSYKRVGELYSEGRCDEAVKEWQKHSDWQRDFTLKPSPFVDVVKTCRDRFKANREAYNSKGKLKPITRFYIDELDEMNGGRDLRRQLSCFMAATGVGKSHIARWIGRSAAIDDGLDVLHIQLEGSEQETTDAYSAAMMSCNVYRYTTGTLTDRDFEAMMEQLREVAGTVTVRAYPKFANQVTTIDIKNAITEYRKERGRNPDVVIIDSMDLLMDSSGRKWSGSEERYKRIAVANDLKDLAAEENVWMVVTYQATIEHQDWLNDEKNVLTEYNCAEAKGLSRPLSHLITLNQSFNEMKEQTMRLFVAKSRFFRKGEPIRIATDYDNERFYDKVRTFNITRSSCA